MIRLLELERPHRSGMLAVAIVYGLLGAMGEIWGNHEGDLTVRGVIVCALMPWDCLRHEEVKVDVAKVEKLEVTRLVYVPPERVKVVKKQKEHRELICGIFMSNGDMYYLKNIVFMSVDDIESHISMEGRLYAVCGYADQRRDEWSARFYFTANPGQRFTEITLQEWSNEMAVSGRPSGTWQTGGYYVPNQ